MQLSLTHVNQFETLAAAIPAKLQKELRVEAGDCADVTMTANDQTVTFRRMFGLHGSTTQSQKYVRMTIPFKVVKQLNLKAGDEVEISFRILTHIPRED